MGAQVFTEKAGKRFLRSLAGGIGLAFLASSAFCSSSPLPEKELPAVLGSLLDEIRITSSKNLPAGVNRSSTLMAVGIPIDEAMKFPLHDLFPQLSPSAAAESSAEYRKAIEALGGKRTEDALFYLEETRAKSPVESEKDSAAFYIGELKRQQKKPGQAILYFGKVRGGSAPEARFRLAVVADEAGRIDEARAAFTGLASSDTSSHRAEALAWTGKDLYLSGEMAGAEKALLESILIGGPGSGDAAFLLGLMRSGRGDFESAEKLLTGFLLNFPEHRLAKSAQGALGWVFLEEKNPEAARRRFGWALEGEIPSSLEPRARYGLVRAASEEGSAGLLREELGGLEKARVDPLWRFRGWVEAGRFFYNSKDCRGALDAFSRAVEIHPEGEFGPAALYMAGESFSCLEEHRAAADTFLRVKEPSSLVPYALLRAGENDLRVAENKRAASSFRAISEKFPAFEHLHKARYLLGKALLASGDDGGAWAAFESIPENSPWFASSLFELALMAHEEENWDRSARLLTKFINVFPADPRRDKAASLLGEAGLMRGDLKAAAVVYADLEKSGTDETLREEARYRRGLILMSEGRTEAGRELFDSLLASSPRGKNSLLIALTLGRSYSAESKFALALPYFEKALAQNPPEAEKKEAEKGLAFALLGAGRHEEALAAFKKLGRTRDGFYGECMSLIKLGRLDLSMAAVDEFAGIYPGDERIFDLETTLAEGLSRVGRQQDAAAYYRRTAERIKGEKRARAVLASARNLAGAGLTEEALEAYGLLSSEKDPVSLTAREELGATLLKLGRFDKAREEFTRLAGDLKEDAGVSAALRNAGKAAAGAGDIESAVKLVNEAFSRAPVDDPGPRQALLADLGEYLLGANRPGEAVKPLRESFSMLQGAEGLRAGVLLGKALEGSGDEEGAIEVYGSVGYLYSLENEEAGRALLRAGDLLLKGGKATEAAEIFKRIAENGSEAVKKEAASRLEAMQ
ncbi:tetratricopeptide repeat protein [bacterium]|nr:MAG: tetratricopeptide repeat protein [bacterium]